jgi:hypothetical protein
MGHGLIHSSAALLLTFQCMLLAASESPEAETPVPADRFFGTQDTENCWADIASQDPIGSEDSVEYRISGVLYCVAPLAELNGSFSISFTDIRFTGRLSWETPK